LTSCSQGNRQQELLRDPAPQLFGLNQAGCQARSLIFAGKHSKRNNNTDRAAWGR
jgi:hypothetical protein